jgi:hypothetical protein
MESAAIGGGILLLLLWLFVVVLSLACSAFWIWMLIDCAVKESSEGNDKLMWILIIVLVGIPGAIIYYFVRRAPRIANAGQ